MNIFIKEIIRSWLKYLPQYRKIRASINESSCTSLTEYLTKAVANVPYYHSHCSLKEREISLSDFPIIRKDDIQGNEDLFVSKHYFKFFLTPYETGGSTGKSLSLYYSKSALIKKNAFYDYALSLIGDNLNIAMLRGVMPKQGALFEQVKRNYHIMSSYLLTSETIDEYLNYLRIHKISCLHVYPSTISIMARLIKNKYGIADLPELKGILSSSEILSLLEKKLIREVFGNIKIVDFYSQNELACCAISVNEGMYSFFNSFGHVEFVDTGERVNDNRICEIVSTGLLNEAMPLIRYATEDYVEVDKNNNVVSIIGRTSDFVYNKKGESAPCIINTRTVSMKNVTNFQYYQPCIGTLVFKVIVTDEFSDSDRQNLLDDMNMSFNGLMDCSVEVVVNIERTKRGKQLRLIQDVKQI